MKVNTDLTKVLTAKHKNKWVAMNSKQTEVLAANKIPEKVLAVVGKMGYKDPVLTFVPESYAGLIP